MDMLDILKDGVKIVQATDNIQLLKNYIDIQNEYFILRQRLDEANEKIRELEERLKNKEKLKLNDKGYYEAEGLNCVYCSRCYEVDNKLVSMHETETSSAIYYKCPQCKNEILKEKKKIEVPYRYNKNSIW